MQTDPSLPSSGPADTKIGSPRNFLALRSSGVRFAIVYALLFSLSAVLFLSVIWWGTVGLLERQVENSVVADLRGLSERWTEGGLPALTVAIEDRLEDNFDHDAIYLLMDPHNHRITGNLLVWPADVTASDAWYQLSIHRPGFHSVAQAQAQAQALTLPGGYRLLVGRDVRGRLMLRNLLADTLLWALAMITALALGGAVLVRSMLRRMIHSIAKTTSAIAHGDMSRRMPMRGRGDELDEVAEAINEMLERISRLMDGVKQVSNSIAHDLRTPITRARTRLEYAAHHAEDETALRQAIEHGVDDLDRITVVFDALLRITQIEAGSRRSAFACFDLVPVLEDIAELYEPVAEEKSIVLSLRLPAVLQFYGDRMMIQQAVSNLLDNALKYSPQDSTVTISAAAGANTGGNGIALSQEQIVTVAVTDQGIGMSWEELARAPERFFRADSARNTPGSGLGLALVQAIVQLHGGALRFSQRNPGLSAEMDLPLTASEVRNGRSEKKSEKKTFAVSHPEAGP
ncbi:HAMP domain-containing protein [Acetobacter sp. AN02]|uniref:sensor histidine kinase n=1 Tax=Acetobacter sp. AN02 TaxID=2894186 RepID=UPI0024346663|nr:ATP-binding protein [Acetobacter sp. AN02]MDG6094446.1 HAMP domain-containing protein [Acetobacter sp. AN02]